MVCLRFVYDLFTIVAVWGAVFMVRLCFAYGCLWLAYGLLMVF